MNNRLDRIFNNLFDLLIISVRIGVNYMVELWSGLSWIWKEDIPPHLNEEVKMWNGGDTFQDDDLPKVNDEITESPSDEMNIMDSKGIIYDGIMDSVVTESLGDVKDDNG